MSIEWFTMMNRNFAATRRQDPLADPLEGEDWRGLGWAATAIAGSLHLPNRQPPQKDRKAAIPLVPAGSNGSI